LDVVPGGQNRKQNLPGLVEMAKVGPGIGAAGIAGAVGVERPFVVLVAGVLDYDAALGGE
jgi:hypothetical protein